VANFLNLGPGPHGLSDILKALLNIWIILFIYFIIIPLSYHFLLILLVLNLVFTFISKIISYHSEISLQII
jgi:hypothetical protein